MKKQPEGKAKEKKTHILLVDDDPKVLRLFGGRLAKKGFEILYAHDGNEGREVARRMKPDLIMLDIRMPVMDGHETLSRLKEEEPTKDIPVIMLSSEDLSIEAEGFMKKELGADAYIPKGTPTDDLVEQINEVLKKHSDLLAKSQ